MSDRVKVYVKSYRKVEAVRIDPTTDEITNATADGLYVAFIGRDAEAYAVGSFQGDDAYTLPGYSFVSAEPMLSDYGILNGRVMRLRFVQKVAA